MIQQLSHNCKLTQIFILKQKFDTLKPNTRLTNHTKAITEYDRAIQKYPET